MPPEDAGGRYYGHTGVKDKTRPGGVYAIAPSADGTTVHVGGTFLSFGGRSGLVSLDAATGQPTPWQAKIDRPVFGLTPGRDGHTFYAATGGTGGRLVAFRPHGPPEGTWQVKTDGDNLAVVETATTVYLIGHYDNIVQPELRLLPVLPRRDHPGAPLGLRPQRQDPGLEPDGQHSDRAVHRHRRRPAPVRGRRVHEDQRRPPRRFRRLLRHSLAFSSSN